MVRKLSLAVALALGVTPFAASALGLGDIKSASALNQPFNADIRLLSLQDEEIEDIRVSVASADVFAKSGIERPYFLTKLKFKPIRLPNGTGYIQVTSDDPIREPFLNFVVEVNWPKGRLFREYTVLLDPPVTIARAPAPVEPARRVVRQSPQPQVTAAAPAPVTVATRAPDLAPNEYGPIRRNETLWAIAKQLRPRGATIEQTVMALFNANPHAFIASDINKLKIGEVLRVPASDAVLSLTAKAARVAFREQMESWRKSAAIQEEVQPEEQLTEDVTPSEQMPPEVEAQTDLPEAELKITGLPQEADGGEASAEGASEKVATTEQLQQDLMVAREVRESALAEGQELKSRINSLESQLDDLQRLLELKDEQLARLQNTLAGTVAAETLMPAGQSPEDTPAMVPPQTEAAMDQTAEAMEQPDADMLAVPGDATAGTPAGETIAVESETAVVEEESEPMTETPAQEAGAETVAEEAPATAPEMVEPPPVDEVDQPAPVETVPEAVVVVPEPSQAEPAVAASPAPVPESGPMAWWKKLTGDTTMVAAAGGGLLLLLALFWKLVSRRRASNEEFQESILVDTLQDGGEGQYAEAGEAAPKGERQAEETSFLSDFSPSDIDVLQDETGEVDPVSEADVYIAYGRYGQAEELIRQAMERDPQRLELKRKLFEILYATKNKKGFTALAEEAVIGGMPQSDAVGWKAVVGMGAELVPDNKLFSVAVEESAGQETEAGIADNGAGDLADLDLEDLSDNLEIDDELQRSLDDVGEIDLADIGLDDPELDLETLPGTGNKENKSGTDQPVIPEGHGIDAGVIESDEIGSYSLDELGDENLADTVIEFSSSQESASERAGDAGLTSPQEEERLELPGMDEEVALSEFAGEDSGTADEVNTKLDLAKAYVEMGDAEGARGILDEVISEGSDTQKQTARHLLEGLG